MNEGTRNESRESQSLPTGLQRHQAEPKLLRRFIFGLFLGLGFGLISQGRADIMIHWRKGGGRNEVTTRINSTNSINSINSADVAFSIPRLGGWVVVAPAPLAPPLGLGVLDVL